MLLRVWRYGLLIFTIFWPLTILAKYFHICTILHVVQSWRFQHFKRTACYVMYYVGIVIWHDSTWFKIVLITKCLILGSNVWLSPLCAAYARVHFRVISEVKSLLVIFLVLCLTFLKFLKIQIAFRLVFRWYELANPQNSRFNHKNLTQGFGLQSHISHALHAGLNKRALVSCCCK